MYLKAKIATMVVASALIMLFVSGVDPYGVFETKTSSYTSQKTRFYLKEPIIKPVRVTSLEPDYVVLGLSRAGVGYDSGHQYFSISFSLKFL